MGSRVWHTARADHHKLVADYLAKDHPDWAAVALFYSAHEWVHSALADEPGITKDERHPRKHTGKGGDGHGGRGTNQMVRDLYPDIAPAYRSLSDMSHRTRYDFRTMDLDPYPLLLMQWGSVENFCLHRSQGRPSISTSAP